jgi:SlyX protein
MADLTEDIVELQTRIQFQEDTIHKLDEVVIRQGALLDRMQRKLVELEDRIEQLGYERGAAGRNSPADEKPPHY